MGFLMILGVFIIPVIAVKTIPSLHSKISYMRYDIDQYLKGNAANYSDAERLISIEAGMKIGNRNPILGVGAGDLKKEVKTVFKNEFPQMPQSKMPHNQFVSVYAGTGIVGLILFFIAFTYPIFYKKNYRNTLFIILHVIVFFSFFIENTIETAIGVAFYTLFLLISLNHLEGNHEVIKS